VIGAVAGALGVIIGAEKLGVDRERAAVGAALVGLTAAANTTGWVRSIASGVAAAGAALTIAERFSSSPKPEAAKRQAESNWVTREELQRALAEFAERQAKAHAEALAELRKGIREVVGEIGSSADAPPPTEPVEAGSTVPSTTGTEPATETPAMSVGKFLEIASQLNDGERARLSEFIGAAPDNALRAAQDLLAQMPPGDAAHYLREHVLRTGTA
jgi:hypothetical protein